MRVTIIPEDRLVNVDGVIKQFDFKIDQNIHAVQWDGNSGSVEQIEGGSRYIDTLDEFSDILTDFAKVVKEDVIVPDDTSYTTQRSEHYPHYGDQLDAIWKQFYKMRQTGTILHPDTSEMLNAILAVKKEFPKPEETTE